MREILFRGKRVDNGEWIQGYYLVAAGMSFMSIFGVMSPTVVIPETVGQYTGLKDKNGQKIFEGDVLKDTLGWVYEVQWDSDCSRFLGYHSKPRGDTYICYVGREPKSTVLGNIHDNPELLNAK